MREQKLIQKVNNKKILDNLDKEAVNVIWVAEHADVNFDSLIVEANKSNIKIAGGIFPGVISSNMRLDDGAIIHHLHQSSKVVLLPLKGQEELPSLHESCKSIYLLVDGLSDGIPSFLFKIYQKYWNKVTYIGGGCGSLSLNRMPCIFTNDGIFQDYALLIMSSDNLQIGIEHGWEKIAGPFLITKSAGNVINQINWEPAFKIFKSVVDKFSTQPLDKNHFFDVAKRYPFGISREGFEDIVRDPIFTEDGESITCVGEMPENTTICILKGNKDQLIESAKAASQIAIKNISPKSIFVVDCISRVLFLEDRFEEELTVIQNELGKQSSIELQGVLSLGEISTYGEGLLEFFNKTIIVSAKY